MQKTANRSRLCRAECPTPPAGKCPIRHKPSKDVMRVQMLRIMRTLSVFLLAAFMSTHADGSAQTVSISGKNLTLEQVFKSVEKQTGYVVLAYKDALSKNADISLNVTAVPLTQLLDIVLKNKSLDYVVKGKTIVLSRKNQSPVNSDPPVSTIKTASPVTIKVADAKGQLLSGASVINKTTGTSGITDANGIVTLNASAGDQLTISFVGMQTKTITVTNAIISSNLHIMAHGMASEGRMVCF